jgi:hypothetical protein
MKKMIFMAMMMTIAISAGAMTYNEARNEALFLSDKMAYELNLTEAQYEAVYEINLDYLMSVNSRYDVSGPWWDRRNADLRYVLASWQYDRYMRLNYFYRPISWRAGAWVFHVHNRYVNHSLFYRPRPAVFLSYRGGHNRLHAGYYGGRHIHHPAVAPSHHNNHGHGPAIGHGNHNGHDHNYHGHGMNQGHGHGNHGHAAPNRTMAKGNNHGRPGTHR